MGVSLSNWLARRRLSAYAAEQANLLKQEQAAARPVANQASIDTKALYRPQLLGLQRQLSLDSWLTRCHNASCPGIGAAGVSEASCDVTGRYEDSLRNWSRCAKPAVIPDAFSNQASHIPQDRLA